MTLDNMRVHYLGFLMILVIVAGAVGTAVALVYGVADWYMWAVMYVAQLLLVLLYAKAFFKQTRVLKHVYLLMDLILFVFWCFILYDRIAPRMVPAADGATLRGEIPALWGPIVLSGLCALCLVGHPIIAWGSASGRNREGV